MSGGQFSRPCHHPLEPLYHHREYLYLDIRIYAAYQLKRYGSSETSVACLSGIK